jgi:hypothetical protein
MTRRERGRGPGKGRARGEAGGGAGHGVAPVYEGPEVLTALLARAGSPHSADEAAAAFKAAQAAGDSRSAAIPTLFPSEPRFAQPEDARRLYANLFGLWARVESGLDAEDGDAPAAVPDPAEPPAPAPLPGRGTTFDPTLEPDLVEAVWRHLAALPDRELQRRRDRFMNAQPDLGAWLDAVPLPAAGGLAAADLAFEAWAMFDQAFGDRLQAVDFEELRALEAEPPPLEAVQPALAAYAAEQLDLVQDEDPGFGDAERAQVERAVAAAVAALAAAVEDGD